MAPSITDYLLGIIGMSGKITLKGVLGMFSTDRKTNRGTGRVLYPAGPTVVFLLFLAINAGMQIFSKAVNSGNK